MPQEPRVRTIQQTSKIWKLGQAIGVLTIAAACLVPWVQHVNRATDPAVRSSPADDGTALAAWFLVGILGLVIYLGSRVLAWWFHG